MENKQAVEDILDEMRIGTPEDDVPLNYLMDDKHDGTDLLRSIYQKHQDKEIQKAVKKASHRARVQIVKHMFELQEQVPSDRRVKLTFLYANKYKSKVSLVGMKRFVLKNKDLSDGEIDKEFNRTFDWDSHQPEF